jgi:hypothetical protein
VIRQEALRKWGRNEKKENWKRGEGVRERGKRVTEGNRK